MDEEVKTTAALYRAAAWAHARRKQLMWTTIAVVVIGLTAAIYIWQKNQNEITAAQAYSQLKSPLGLETLPATAADPYIHLANDYSGTQAAARSLLVAGSILFDSGKFKESQTQFERLIREYPDFPEGQRKWDERTFHPNPAGEIVPVYKLWPNGTPSLFRKLFAVALLLEHRQIRDTMRGLIPGDRNQLFLSPEHSAASSELSPAWFD